MSGDEPIFAEALALPPEDRAAFLDRACAGDAARRERIASLLAAHDEPDQLEPVARRDPPAVPAEQPGDVLGRYKLLQKIGEGGCGVVWMAQQEDPVRRRVALKVIKLGMDTRSVVARFDAERQALAIMDHPGIAKVLDAGATAVGRPYFVMELVRGVPLTKFCDEHQVSPRERLELFIKVCHAIQHAHQKGIIHRDIKPSNILVSMNDGVAVPKVIDFGIAKATQGRLTDATLFTAFEQFMGTPAYMSPEQAEMTSLDVDTRSDVYSLGVLLYELLTGKTPFDTQALLKAGVDEIRRVIRESNPPLPSRRLSTLSDGDRATVAKSRGTVPSELNGLLRGDLDWIAMRCLEKDRSRRYDTANSLAEDIRRHLDNRPVVARPPSSAYLFGKFIRRNRLAFAAGLAVALVVVIGSIVSVGLAIRARRLERAADTRAAEARLATYTAEMNLAQNALVSGNLAQAVRLLNKHRPGPGEPDLRGFEWRYLAQSAKYAEFDTFATGFSGHGLATSPDGALFATTTVSGDIEVRALPAGRLVQSLARVGSLGVLQFSKDGRWLFAAYRRGAGLPPETRRWNTQGWEEAPALVGIGPPIANVLDGAAIAGAATDGRLELWSTSTWAKLRDLSGSENLTGRVQALAASPDGKVLFAGGDRTVGVRAWDLVRNVELERLPLPYATTTVALAVSSRGQLAGANDNGAVTVWNVGDHSLVVTHDEHNGAATAVAFSDDGLTLASAGDDQRIILYDTTGRGAPRRLSGHTGPISALAFPPGNRSIISASEVDRTVLRWTAIPAADESNVLHAAYSLGFGKRGDDLITWSATDGFAMFELGSQAKRLLPYKLPNGFDPAAFTLARISPVAPLLAYIRADGVVVCDLDSGVERVVLKPTQGSFKRVAFSRDGRYLAATGVRSGIWLWEVAGWKGGILPFPLETINGNIAFSNDGAFLAAMERPRLAVFRTAARDKVLEAQGSGDITGTLAFSPDGTKLALGQIGEKGTRIIRLLRLDPGAAADEVTIQTGHLGRIRGIAFSADGRTIATCGEDFQVKLWSAENYSEILTLPSRRAMSQALWFSPDGQWLVADSTDDLIQLWHAPKER